MLGVYTYQGYGHGRSVVGGVMMTILTLALFDIVRGPWPKDRLNVSEEKKQ